MELRRILIFVSLVTCFTIPMIAQSYILTFLDKDDATPLLAVNVYVNDYTYQTDELGQVIIEALSFPLTIEATYVGYDKYLFSVRKSTELPSTIYMAPTQTVLDQVTVTGTKYEQNIARSAVSLDIIKPELLYSVNASSADKILNKVPGVQVLDGQANIRGGSGFSYGAGSRVMLLIDDIPALQPDAGFPNWSDIPIENLSQIEILKGAASTFYGSAALNGIINYRTAYAKSIPETRISSGNTMYLSPKDKDKKWWGDTIRYETNLSIVHKQKFNKIDFIASGFYNRLRGFNQFTNEDRGRGNLNLRYRYSDRLVFSFNTIINSTNTSAFFLWKGAGRNAMQPLEGTVSDRQSTRIYIDPKVTYTDDHNNFHKLLWRTTIIDNTNNTNQSNNSLNNYGEYQFQRNFEKVGLILTSGFVATHSATNSQILGDTTFIASSTAGYFQLDYKANNRLSIGGGLRYEHSQQKSPENFMGVIIPDGIAKDGQMISRLSANYQLAEYTFLRGSYGQGYRYPTLTERFVTTTFGSFSIFSNPNLRPEYGYTTELGIKQGFGTSWLKGFFDAAVFQSEYTDMIEFTFVFEPNRIGFQPQNIGNTRIRGWEVGFTGQAFLLGAPITIFGGYTFIDPIYKNFDASEVIRNSISGTENVLKYRSKHQFKMDAEGKIGAFKVGGSYQYTSNIVNIDRAFEAVPPIDFDLFGIGGYRKINNTGFGLLDARLGYTYHKLTFTALINNILNKEYTLRPALVEAPRNIGLRIDWKING